MHMLHVLCGPIMQENDPHEKNKTYINLKNNQMLRHQVKSLLWFGKACDVICASLFQMGKLRHVESIQLLEVS